MSPFSRENIDDALKSMDRKLDISKQEQNEILSEMNRKIKQQHPPTPLKKYNYYLAFSVAAILLFILTLPTINSFITNSSEISANEFLWKVKEELEIGMTESEVIEMMGSDYAEVVSAMDDQVVWRYDVETVTGYNFVASDDFVDMEGLQNGEVKVQLFITWGENSSVEKFSAIYLDENDGNIYDYRVFPDNSVKETILNVSPEINREKTESVRRGSLDDAIKREMPNYEDKEIIHVELGDSYAIVLTKANPDDLTSTRMYTEHTIPIVDIFVGNNENGWSLLSSSWRGNSNTDEMTYFFRFLPESGDRLITFGDVLNPEIKTVVMEINNDLVEANIVEDSSGIKTYFLIHDFVRQPIIRGYSKYGELIYEIEKRH